MEELLYALGAVALIELFIIIWLFAERHEIEEEAKIHDGSYVELESRCKVLFDENLALKSDVLGKTLVISVKDDLISKLLPQRDKYGKFISKKNV